MRYLAGSRVAALAVVPAVGDGRLAGFCRKLAKGPLDPYRPELHYMRGPGPKWREKHGTTAPR